MYDNDKGDDMLTQFLCCVPFCALEALSASSSEETEPGTAGDVKGFMDPPE